MSHTTEVTDATLAPYPVTYEPGKSYHWELYRGRGTLDNFTESQIRKCLQEYGASNDWANGVIEGLNRMSTQRNYTEFALETKLAPRLGVMIVIVGRANVNERGNIMYTAEFGKFRQAIPQLDREWQHEVPVGSQYTMGIRVGGFAFSWGFGGERTETHNDWLIREPTPAEYTIIQRRLVDKAAEVFNYIPNIRETLSK